MRLSAYVLAADPAWLEASIASYYPLVDRLVVSFDENNVSWTGTPLEVDQCLRAVRALDVENKVHFAPGHYARLDHAPLENDTYQRQCALDLAGEDADWVLQLDTDEVVADPATFLAAIAEADRRGFGGVEYPARVLYKQIGRNRFLEQCGRFWGHAAGFPGPVAVRAGARLTLCRQADVPLYRVDLRSHNTDPWHGADAPVHRVIAPSSAIYHFCWVRSEEHMRRKAKWSGHVNDFDWAPKIEKWMWCGRHPYLATLATPLHSRPGRGRVRPMAVADTIVRFRPAGVLEAAAAVES